MRRLSRAEALLDRLHVRPYLVSPALLAHTFLFQSAGLRTSFYPTASSASLTFRSTKVLLCNSRHASPPVTFATEVTPDWFAQGRVANMVRRLKSESSRDSVLEINVSKLSSPGSAGEGDEIARAHEGLRVLALEAIGSGGSMCTIHISVSVMVAPLTRTSCSSTESPNATSSSGRLKSAPKVSAAPAKRAVAFTALGFGIDERHATAAAAMHAERLADANGIHVFGLPRMQEKHAIQCRQHGRWAPMPTECLNDIPADASGAAPMPVLLKTAAAPELESPLAKHRPLPGAQAQSPATTPAQLLRKRNAAKLSHSGVRFDPIPFIRPETMPSSAKSPQQWVDDEDPDDRGAAAAAAGEGFNLQQNTDTAFRNSSEGPDDACVSASQAEVDRMWDQAVIEPSDVTIVAPSSTQAAEQSNPEAETPQPAEKEDPLALPANAMLPRIASSERRDHTHLKHSRLHLKDESEGHAYQMVEQDNLWDHAGAPGMLCLMDDGAKQRLTEAVHQMQRAAGCSEGEVGRDWIKSRMRVTTSTPFAEPKLNAPPSLPAPADSRTTIPTWYIVSMELPLTVFALAFLLARLRSPPGDGESRNDAAEEHKSLVEAVQNALRLTIGSEEGGRNRPFNEDRDHVVSAVGKADSVEVAENLCAMHAERLLEQLGVSLFPFDPLRDAQCVDACLCYGRRRGPALMTKFEVDHEFVPACRAAVRDKRTCEVVSELVSITEGHVGRRLRALRVAGSFAALCRPLKLWRQQRSGDRRRHSSLGPEEALLALHRIVIAAVRIHTLDLDIADAHSDWLSESIVICRHFFAETIRHQHRSSKAAAAGHPHQRIVPLDAELPFAVFNLAPNQFRCSLFLPLERHFGVRGGYAVGTTPQAARGYCALHALDVLCALGVPVFRDAEKQAAFVAKRRERGLICPQEAPIDPATGRRTVPAELAARGAMLSGGCYISFPKMRSPPVYREHCGCSPTIPPSMELWTAMTLDAYAFDICRDVPSPASGVVIADAMRPLLPPPSFISISQEKLKPLLEHYCRAGETAAIKSLALGCLERLGLRSADLQRTVTMLSAQQRLGSNMRLPANNMWLRLPLDTKIYGVRVAMGRGPHRKGAERALLVHVLRILLALDVPELQTLVLKVKRELVGDLYVFCLVHWHPNPVPLWLMEAITKMNEVSFVTKPRRTNAATPLTIPVSKHPTVESAQHVPSPNPVMTMELAKKTFVP